MNSLTLCIVNEADAYATNVSTAQRLASGKLSAHEASLNYLAMAMRWAQAYNYRHDDAYNAADVAETAAELLDYYAEHITEI